MEKGRKSLEEIAESSNLKEIAFLCRFQVTKNHLQLMRQLILLTNTLCLCSCLNIDNTIEGNFGSSSPPEGALISILTPNPSSQAIGTISLNCGNASHYLIGPQKPEPENLGWNICSSGNLDLNLTETTNSFSFWFKREKFVSEEAQHLEILFDNLPPQPPSAVYDGTSMASLDQSPPILYSPGSDDQTGILKHQVRLIRESDLAIIKDWTDHESADSILAVGLASQESYRVEARALDRAGNVSTIASSDGWIAGLAQGVHNLDFASSGVYSTSGNYNYNIARKIIVATDQKILVTGVIRDLGEWGDIFLHRLLPSGASDTTFGTTGKLVFDLSPYDFGTGLFIDSMNRIILGGAYTTTENPFLWRFTENGSSDLTFGTNGFVAKSVAGENVANAMTVDPSDGSYYIVGDDYGDSAYLTKFTVNGSVDSTFATNGYYLITTHVYARAIDALVDANGKLVVVGGVQPGGSGDDSAAIIWRFNANGTPDTTFNSPLGYLILDNQLSTDVFEQAGGILIDSSNNYLVVGGASNNLGNTDLIVWNINSTSATPIPSFGGLGTGYALVKDIGTSNGNEIGSKMKNDAMGNLVIVATSSNGSNNDIAIVRLLSNGVLDASFGNSGAKLVTDLAGYSGNDSGYDLDINESGSIFVCGSSEKASGDTNAIVIRID